MKYKFTIKKMPFNYTVIEAKDLNMAKEIFLEQLYAGAEIEVEEIE